MHGNVTEWALDQLSPDFYKVTAGKGNVTDPWNKATKPYPHVVRGGSWASSFKWLRVSDREWDHASNYSGTRSRGFRLAQDR